MRRTALARTTPLRRVSAKRKAHYVSDDGKAGVAHMARVKALPCVICWRSGPSDAHHVIHDRYGARKASDFAVIPLCVACHRYPHPLAIHTDKAAWRERNGADFEFLPVVADMLAGQLNAP